MLLAGLQAEAIGTVAVTVHAHPHDPPRQSALIGILGGHIGRMRAAITHRHAEPLRRAHGDVGAHGPGSFSRVSASGSAITMPMALASCNAAISSVKSRRCPCVPGY